jgi:hypothetical protein
MNRKRRRPVQPRASWSSHNAVTGRDDPLLGDYIHKSLLKPWVAQPMNYPEPTAQQQTQPWLAKVDKEALAD